MDELNLILNDFLAELGQRFPGYPSIFKLWFNDFKLISLDENGAVFTTPTALRKKMIMPYYDLIKSTLSDLLGTEINVEIVSEDNKNNYSDRDAEQVPVTPPEVIEKAVEKENKFTEIINSDNSSVLDEYTFDTFVEGSSNTFARAACYAVAKEPCTYNPLFIHGQSGLGKTHLLYAIINDMKKNNPTLKIVYKKSESFINELVGAIQTGSTAQFKEKYRTADVLLIDDIQFIAGKESTQEEFFHTFSVLYEADKQIILTSDRPPQDINPLEDRLRTRFEGGLIADVQPPNFELRAAIITKKSDAMGLNIDKELIDYLAERLQKDVRQIEGVLKRINAVTSLSGQKVTKEIVDQAISVIDPGNIPTDAMIERILKVVCRHYGISEENIKSKNRTDTVANARHTAIYIIKELTDLTLNEIGNIFGRNHATVIASINKVNTNMRTVKNADADIKRMIKEIKG